MVEENFGYQWPEILQNEGFLLILDGNTFNTMVEENF